MTPIEEGEGLIETNMVAVKYRDEEYQLADCYSRDGTVYWILSAGESKEVAAIKERATPSGLLKLEATGETVFLDFDKQT